MCSVAIDAHMKCMHMRNVSYDKVGLPRGNATAVEDGFQLLKHTITPFLFGPLFHVEDVLEPISTITQPPPAPPPMSGPKDAPEWPRGRY